MIEALGGEEEPLEFAAVQSAPLGWMDLGTANVLGRVGSDPRVHVGEAVEATGGREAAVDGRGGQTALFHRGPVQLEIVLSGQGFGVMMCFLPIRDDSVDEGRRRSVAPADPQPQDRHGSTRWDKRKPGSNIERMPIVPDSKDWTWVLERRCPECGFDASTARSADVAGMIRLNATRWNEVLARPDVRQRPSGDRWSPLEYGCHVRDVYRLYDHRLRLMLEEDDPQYPNWDQDVTAIEDRYGEQDPGVVEAELRDAAVRLAARFDTVEGQAWHRTGRRSDGARFTVDTFSRYLIHDPIHHLWDVGVVSVV